jgi:DNA-binding FadR family transcriptional regulator
VASGAARRAAERSDANVIKRLKTCVARGEKSLGDPTAFLQVDEEFHRVIVHAVRNPFMERLAQSLQILGRKSREITAQVPSIRQQTHSDHLQILESLIERDPDQASRAMQQHLCNVRDAYRREQAKHGTSSPEQPPTEDSLGSS